jgi:hypothetical protein
VLLHLQAQLERDLHEADALRLDHHIREEFGQIVLAADLQDIGTDRHAGDLEAAFIIGSTAERTSSSTTVPFRVPDLTCRATASSAFIGADRGSRAIASNTRNDIDLRVVMVLFLSFVILN